MLDKMRVNSMLIIRSTKTLWDVCDKMWQDNKFICSFSGAVSRVHTIHCQRSHTKKGKPNFLRSHEGVYLVHYFQNRDFLEN